VVLPTNKKRAAIYSVPHEALGLARHTLNHARASWLSDGLPSKQFAQSSPIGQAGTFGLRRSEPVFR